ncbi:MAG: Uma2 family endonuclease [Phaeodactylibacter sp.]|nr:Uma2 family endonuclease [Phaeodactylibacter sp.]
MTQASDLIRPILESPNLRALLDEMEALWEEEQQKRQEFYDRITPEDKWEFINGQIIMHSPAKNKHLDATKLLTQLLDLFVRAHDLGSVKTEKALIPTTRNDYEPDVVFFNKQKAGRFTSDQWKFPAPDLVVEVLSQDSITRDRQIKYRDYALHYIPEYWIIDPDALTVEQYRLNDAAQNYELFAKKVSGDYFECSVIPGFKAPVDAIFDEKANLAALRHFLKE